MAFLRSKEPLRVGIENLDLENVFEIHLIFIVVPKVIKMRRFNKNNVIMTFEMINISV